MLFSKDAWPGIAGGEITLTFRRWKRLQATVGKLNRTPAGPVVIDAIDVVALEDITDADARAAGHADAATLRTLLGGNGPPIQRIRFHLAPDGDPRDALAARDELSADDLREIEARLGRLDRGAAWTRATLQAIADHPEVRAADLAASLGRERADFKLDVRTLKALGLTLSLPVGYRLSPRGRAYLEWQRSRTT